MYSRLPPSTPSLHFLFSLVFLYSIALSYQQVCNHQDQSALVTFYDTIQDSSLNWQTNTSCCQWKGVMCNNNGSVTHLKLSSREILGVISSSIANLSYLSHLNLSNNAFFGPLPKGLFGFMDSLKVIDLSSNNLSGNLSLVWSSRGDFPLKVHTIDISNNKFEGNVDKTWFSRMQVLTNFNCSNNKFSGSIPSFICLSSPILKTLDLSHNHFSGLILNEIKKCSHLEVFRAGFNSLSGSIPKSMFGLEKLLEISIPSNHLHGYLELGSVCRHSNLRVVDFSSNNLSGSIPKNIEQLLNLEKLYLSNNNLTSLIPSSLMSCRNITEIIIRNNFVDGEISGLDWSGLAQLQKIDFLNNKLHGSLPESIYSCKSLVAIRIAHNNFTGQISPKVVELKSLSYISIASNAFTNITSTLMSLANCQSLRFLSMSYMFYGETLPSKKSFVGSTSFPNLQTLCISFCQLSGFFPKWLVHIKTLEVLVMSGNNLTGRLPNWIGTFPNLYYLGLFRNNFFGELPQELCQLPTLVSIFDPRKVQFHYELPIFTTKSGTLVMEPFTYPTIYLSFNNFCGHIPSNIGSLQSLKGLYLNDNKFSGHIPSSISNLLNLEELDLSRNNLTGDIPTSLESLHFLSSFNVSCNDLKGPIPNGGQLTTFDSSSFEENPSLCGDVLRRPCSSDAKVQPHKDNDGEINKKSFFINGLLVGFVFGFLSVLILAGFTLKIGSTTFFKSMQYLVCTSFS